MAIENEGENSSSSENQSFATSSVESPKVTDVKIRKKSKKKMKKVNSGKASKSQKAEKVEMKIERDTDYWKIAFYALAIILIVGISVFAIMKFMKTEPKSASSKKVSMVEYSDFECPYCKKAESTVRELKKIYGNNLEVTYKHYPLSGHQFAQKAAEASECARDQGKFWEMHDKLMDSQALDVTSLKKYAIELGLDSAKFDICLDTGAKASVVKADFDEGAKLGVTGTPAFFINGKKLVGARPINDFKKIIDSELAGPDFGNANSTQLTVLSDKTCDTCDSSNLVSQLNDLMIGLKVNYVDVSSAEGQKLVQDLNIQVVPAYIFNANLANEDIYANPQAKQYFQKIGDNYKLVDQVTGANWYLDPVKRAQFLEAQRLAQEERAKLQAEAITKLGISKNDNKPQIDFFVMSYCPYGNLAEEAIEPVYQTLQDKAIFKPRYVYYSDYATSRGGTWDQYCLDENQTYCSMHGIQEAHQNIREQCVEKYYGIDDWFKFALAMNSKCGAQNADSCWNQVAKDLGYDTQKIANCQANEWETFAKVDYELEIGLGVQGSPTIFVEGIEGGRDANGGLTPNSILSSLCGNFETAPPECANAKLSATTAAPTGNCG